MKVFVAISTFFLCFLISIFSSGQDENQSSANSYVAEMKKNNTDVSSDNNSSYVSSLRKKNMTSENTNSNETSFIHSSSSVSVSSSSYIEQMRQSSGSQKIDSALALVVKKADEIIPDWPKKVGRLMLVSHPLKRAWTKLVSLGKRQSQPSDLNFDPADFPSIAKWAEEQGKTKLARRVIKKYGEWITALAAEFGVDYRIIVAICTHESGGNPGVVSCKKAAGLMQLMPITAASYGLDSISVFDPYSNLRAGTHYYSDMFRLFGNDKDAIYAYGWGQGAARRDFDKGIKSEEVTGVQEVLYLAQNQ